MLDIEEGESMFSELSEIFVDVEKAISGWEDTVKNIKLELEN